MKKEINYRAYIINDHSVETMIVSGINKSSTIKRLTDFYIKSNKILDFKRFRIFLVRVYFDGKDYIELE